MELSEEQLAENKAKFTEAVKKILPILEDVQFFMGQGCNPDGMVFLLQYRRKPDGSEEAYMIFFKHGLEAEKC